MNNNNLSREEMKRFVEELVKNLAQRGVKVGGGALMKLDDNGKVEAVDSFGSLSQLAQSLFGQQPISAPKQAPKSLLPPNYAERIRRMSKEQFEAERSELKNTLEELVTKLTQKLEQRKAEKKASASESKEEVQEELSEEDMNCTCPSCLNYDNFEEKLSKKVGKFDYAEITLGGKLFKIKYHLAESGEENISLRDFSDHLDINSLNLEELQIELQKAVTDKKFDKAQLILNTIQERKNKN